MKKFKKIDIVIALIATFVLVWAVLAIVGIGLFVYKHWKILLLVAGICVWAVDLKDYIVSSLNPSPEEKQRFAESAKQVAMLNIGINGRLKKQGKPYNKHMWMPPPR